VPHVGSVTGGKATPCRMQESAGCCTQDEANHRHRRRSIEHIKQVLEGPFGRMIARSCPK